MKFYTVHLGSASDPLFTPDRNAIFVREGFNWTAFVFTWLWALVTRVWLGAVILLSLEILIGAGLTVLGADEDTMFFVVLGWHVIVGFAANDLRRATLSRSGYRENGIVAATDEVAAERRFFAAHPEMARL